MLVRVREMIDVVANGERYRLRGRLLASRVDATYGWRSNVTIIERDAATNAIRDVRRAHNLITNGGLNWLRDVVTGVNSDGTIDELAWGDGAVAPTVNDTSLGNELGRKAVDDRANGPGNGAAITTVLLLSAEANEQIEEFGWIASTTLIARVLDSRLKDESISLQVDRTDTFARG